MSLQDGNVFVDIRAITNPAKDRLSEVLSALRANKEVCIELYNVSGVRLQATVINSSQQTAFVDVTGLPKGMYLLKSCNRLEIPKERIIKNKICINVFD